MIVDDLVIATKAGLLRTGPDVWPVLGFPAYLRQECEMSLRRLGVEITREPLGVVALYRWLRQRHVTAHRVLLRWVLGKRVWLGFGLLLHAGIDLTVNVGTFSQAIVVPYLCWLSGRDVDAFWRYLLSRRLRPGDLDQGHLRVVVDQVASLTDESARAWGRRLL